MWVADFVKDVREERLKLREERIDFVRSLLSPPKSKAEIEEEDRRGRAEEPSGKREEETEIEYFMYDEVHGWTLIA